MTLQMYKSGRTQVWFKVITGKAHPSFAEGRSKDQIHNLGIAFRTQDAPIGYLPFFGSKDFNLNGETSFKEQVLSRLPIDFSGTASPHTLLIKEAAEDVEFMGAGSEDMVDIELAVRHDLLSHGMRLASGVFVDGIMMGLGGPVIKSLLSQLMTSKIKQFVLSKAMTSAIKTHLKEEGNFDVDNFLKAAPK